MKCKICGSVSDNEVNDMCVDCLAERCGDIVEGNYGKIVFIDLRSYSMSGNFAFFDVLEGRFEIVFNRSTWDTFHDFERCVDKASYFINHSAEIARHRAVCPSWLVPVSVVDKLVDNVALKCKEFMSYNVIPEYVIMNGETRTMMINNSENVTTDGDVHKIDGLEIIINEALEYGKTIVTGSPAKYRKMEFMVR